MHETNWKTETMETLEQVEQRHAAVKKSTSEFKQLVKELPVSYVAAVTVKFSKEGIAHLVLMSEYDEVFVEFVSTYERDAPLKVMLGFEEDPEECVFVGHYTSRTRAEIDRLLLSLLTLPSGEA